MSSIHKIVILAGGEGTRLRPLTLTRPKPMIPLGRKPVIDYLINHVASLGFKDVIITVNYLKEQITNYVGDGSKYGLKVQYVVEPEGVFLGTAGSVKLTSRLLDLDDTFIVMQGDTCTKVNLHRVMEFHKKKGVLATLVLKEVDEPWNYGVAVQDCDGRIMEFQEKPPRGHEKSNLVSTGIYCLEPEVLDYITVGECDFARDVFPRILSVGEPIYGYLARGFWTDVGSLRGYLAGLRNVLREETSPAGTPKRVIKGKNVSVEKSSVLIGPLLIEDDVYIGNECRIGPYVAIKRGCSIGDHSVIENSAIFEEARIGPRSVVRDSIVGERAKLVLNARTIESSIVGPEELL